MTNLDQLLQLAGLLGADAAWLLRTSDEAALAYTLDDEPRTIVFHETLGPNLFVARFPDDGSDPGLTEIKPAPGGDREIQVAAALSVCLDALTRIGPSATVRVVEWAFKRYGIEPPRYGGPWHVLDRRQKRQTAPPVEPPAPEQPEPPSEATIGELLREQRQELGLSQHALAERAGIKQARLSQIERGVYQADEETLERLTEALEAIRRERGSE